jgi:hypothetical protein
VLLRNSTKEVGSPILPLVVINLCHFKSDPLSYFEETFSRSARWGVQYRTNWGHLILNTRKKPLEGTPEYYRERAAEMLKKAEEAATDTARSSYLQLAASWQQLAQKLEQPSW